VAYGIKDADTVNAKLHSAHCYRGRSALECYDRPWLDVNNTYSECTNALTESLEDWSRYLSRGYPFFFMEGRYENEGGSVVCMRYQAYYSILCGSTGHFFGNCPLWHFGYSSSWCGLDDWQAELNSPGSLSMPHVKALFHSREWHKLVPDVDHSVVTAGYSAMASALTSDSATLIAYMPSGRQVTVNLDKLSGASVNAWWFSPSTGAAVSIGTFAKSGTRNFTPSGGSDRVLVVDAASRNFPAPGEEDLYTGQEKRGAGLLPGLEILHVRPNPFRVMTRVAYTVPAGPDGKVRVRIDLFNQNGQRVRTLVNAVQPAGRHAVMFDGKDASGHVLPSGVYVCRLKAGEGQWVKRFVSVK
jgi:hypothetical protein